MRLLIPLLAILALQGCTSRDETKRTLEDYGFTNIVIGGYSFSCGRDDSFCTSFTATNPAGRPVRGAVGCGFMKGCTVRF